LNAAVWFRRGRLLICAPLFAILGGWGTEFPLIRLSEFARPAQYACAGCEGNGNNPRMETAARPEMAINKGMAGPGLLAYIVTSKFSDYVGFPVMWRSALICA
jgi:hypothetical protein